MMIQSLLKYVDLNFLFDVVLAITEMEFTIQNVFAVFIAFFS